MRVLVTGGAGFVGSALVDRLLARGEEVTVVDDLSAGGLSNLAAARRVNLERPGAFTLHRADLTAAGLDDIVAAARPEVVHHLAAPAAGLDPVSEARSSVVGAVAVLQAAALAGTELVVVAGSGAVYGAPARQPVSERSSLDPLSPAGAAKAAVEPYLRAYRARNGLPATVLALGTVYGPRRTTGVVRAFADALLAGRRATVFGDGTAVRDFVHVDDVVDAFVLAGGHGGAAPAPGRRLNVAGGEATPVRELHRLVAATVGAPDEPELAAPRAGELPGFALEIRAARQVGWVPRTPLSAGLAGLVDALRERAAP